MQTISPLPNTPSIHNIIIQDHTAQLHNQIKQLFKPQTYPTFPIQQLLSHSNYNTDQRFYLLVTELKDWNKKVQSKQLKKDSRAELYRNKFLFTSLKNAMVNSSKGAVNYQTNMNKLYEWWRQNSKNQMPLYYTARRRNNQDQDWQVRKTFKSNMPLQLKTYERRALFVTQEDIRFLNNNKKSTPSRDNLVDYSAIKEFNSKQLKLRQFRQEKEIQASKSLLKSKKARFDQNHSQNSHFYKGNFSQLYKTASSFGLKNNKSSIKVVNKSKNCSSYSLLQNQTQQMQNIKKYRLNCTIAKKGPIFQQRQPNLSKTTKSFFSKPYDATVTDFEENLLNTPNPAFRKQISITVDQLKNEKSHTIVVSEQNQNGNKEQYIEFRELSNWDGARLMSNPFEHKKQLKKKKKN